MIVFFQPLKPARNFSTDKSAADPRIDELRAKIRCVEEKRYSVEYHDPEKRSIGNAITVELNDGTKLDEVEVEYPVGHKRRVSQHSSYIGIATYTVLSAHRGDSIAHGQV
jgi:2-methylcitrate dehydratase PrpD